MEEEADLLHIKQATCVLRELSKAEERSPSRDRGGNNGREVQEDHATVAMMAEDYNIKHRRCQAMEHITNCADAKGPMGHVELTKAGTRHRRTQEARKGTDPEMEDEERNMQAGTPEATRWDDTDKKQSEATNKSNV